MLESFSDIDDDDAVQPKGTGNSFGDLAELSARLSTVSMDESNTEVRKLLSRKDELERRHRMQEHNSKRLQVIFISIYLVFRVECML